MQSLLTLTCSTPLTLCLLDIHYALLWAVLCSGAQSLCRIICSMVSGRCRHATVCVSNQLLPAQLQYTFYLQVCFTFCEHYQIHLLQTKMPDFLRYSNPSLTWPSYNLLWVATYFDWYQICLLADKWWRVQEKNNGNNAVMTMELQVQEKEKWPSVNFHLREVIKKNGKKAVRLTAWGGIIDNR